MNMALIKVRGPPKLMAENNKLLDPVLFEISGTNRVPQEMKDYINRGINLLRIQLGSPQSPLDFWVGELRLA